jgi:hypothetical protein
MLLRGYKEITLFVTNNHATAYQMAQGRLEWLGRWPIEIEGLLRQDFADFLDQEKEAVFNLVVDIAEEEFAIEDIPRLRSRDAKAMLARKLAQRFRLADYRHAYRIDKSNWRDWNKNIPCTYVLTALTQITPLEGLLGHLQRLQTRVRGVYTTSMLVAKAVPALLKTGAGLLLVEHLGALRQVLVVDGYVRFARLAPIADSHDSGFFEQELNRMIQYLQIGRLVSNEVMNSGALEVHIFSRRVPVKLPPPVLGTQTIVPVWHQIETLTPVLPEDDDEANPYGMEPMYASAQLRARSRFFYQPQTLIRHWQIYLFRKFLNSFSVGLVLVIATAALALQMNINAELERQQYLTQQTQKLEREYQQIKSSFPPLPVAADDLKGKVDLLQRMASRSTAADSVISLVGEQFGAFPDLRITSLVWSVPSQNDSLPAGSLPASGTQQADPATTESALVPRSFVVEGLLVPTRPLTKQESNELVRELQRRLLADCACEIEIKLPFDISEQGAIVDQVGKADEKIETARFSLNLEFKRRPDNVQKPGP